MYISNRYGKRGAHAPILPWGKLAQTCTNPYSYHSISINGRFSLLVSMLINSIGHLSRQILRLIRTSQGGYIKISFLKGRFSNMLSFWKLQSFAQIYSDVGCG